MFDGVGGRIHTGGATQRASVGSDLSFNNSENEDNLRSWNKKTKSWRAGGKEALSRFISILLFIVEIYWLFFIPAKCSLCWARLTGKWYFPLVCQMFLLLKLVWVAFTAAANIDLFQVHEHLQMRCGWFKRKPNRLRSLISYTLHLMFSPIHTS